MPGEEDNDLNELEEQQNERSYEEDEDENGNEREEAEDEVYDVIDAPVEEDLGDELDELQGLASSDINEVSEAPSDYI